MQQPGSRMQHARCSREQAGSKLKAAPCPHNVVGSQVLGACSIHPGGSPHPTLNTSSPQCVRSRVLGACSILPGRVTSSHTEHILTTSNVSKITTLSQNMSFRVEA